MLETITGHGIDCVRYSGPRADKLFQRNVQVLAIVTNDPEYQDCLLYLAFRDNYPGRKEWILYYKDVYSFGEGSVILRLFATSEAGESTVCEAATNAFAGQTKQLTFQPLVRVLSP